MKAVGLYSGIGGLELGFERAGFETSLLVEVDSFCQSVLTKRFKAPIVGDIANVEELPVADAMVAGFPCQPYSQAGETHGLHRGRYEIDQIFRLIDSLGRRKPPIVVLENVPNIIFLQRGQALSYVLAQVEARGYRWAYRVIDTESFGVPHRRRRWILVASTVVDPSAVLLATDYLRPEISHASAHGFYWTEGNSGIGWADDAIPPLKGGSGVNIASPPAIWNRLNGVIGVPTIRDAERLQGLKIDWTLTEATAVGIGARNRWRMVGNAVSVPVARWIALRILRAPVTNVVGHLLQDSKLPKAAFFDGRHRRAADVSPYPTSNRRLRILEYLRDDCVPLSYRATRGFRVRYQSSSLKKDKAFLEALRRHEKQAS